MADQLSGLSVEPLLGGRGFNWVFLVDVLVCGVLAVFFLFYFNRLFATLVAYLIRAWTWHKYKAYIDIQALQISLLGGRIFFKSIRYHAHNVTVLIHDGHITWRYWLRQVQQAEVFQDEKPPQTVKARSTSASKSDSGSNNEKQKSRSRSVGKEENAGIKPKKDLPCRISVKVSGVEAFIYNRSPAYDIILEQTLKHAKPPSSSGSDGQNAQDRSSSSDGKHGDAFGASAEKVATNDTIGTSPARASKEEKPDIPAFLRMFPIKIECKRAAAAVGNENTTSVVVAKVEKSGGTIDAGHAGPLDPYKLLFNFDLETVNVALKPNRDYKEEQLKAAHRILRQREAGQTPAATIESKVVRNVRTRWNSFSAFFHRKNIDTGSLRMQSDVDGAPAALPDPLPGQEQWHGLARYLDEKELDEHDEWRDVEYAKASTVADIEKVHLRFYFDIPGKVTRAVPDTESFLDATYAEDMNGCKPPDYGMDFFVYGGVVTYGPWADRERINLQQAFFPTPFVDAIPPTPLKPGEWRIWSLFKIFVSVEKDVILRIPSRESSKDKKWQGRAKTSRKEDERQEDAKGRKHSRRRRHMGWRRNKQANNAADVRPYGWLDVTVRTDSTVNYLMDMFPHREGYRNKLDLDVKGTEISSSVNHGLLWRTGNVTLDGDLSQPISWNSLRNWPFNIVIHDLELFILRDHFFLIIDLVNDWSAGASPDFYTFVPYAYQLRMLFQNFIIYLNVNDANIVNDPADFEKNDFLTLEGTLDSTLDISMEHFRPERNWIQFDVLTTDMRMRMLSPSRSTFSTFLKDKEVATLPKLTLKGSYSGHMEERPGLTDTLRFDIVGSGLTLKAYGFLVRQLVGLKENYFGDYMHFKTLEEFQGADEDLAVANVKTASIPKPTSINELDVILCIIAEDVTVLAPTNLYACDDFVRIELPVANLDLRILSYYLDMGLQMSPISILAGSAKDDESPIGQGSSTQLFVKHVDLDGHRAFGPPPDEPPYVSQWYIDVGTITGECSSAFIHDLTMAARAFVFTFPDRENALPLGAPSVFNEATFVQVKTDILRLWAHVGKDAILLSLDPVEVAVNDLAGDTFSQRISLLAPKITLACVDAKSASRQRSLERKRTPIPTYAFFQTGATVNVVERKYHFAEERRKQQEHIRVNDQRTKRFPFLLRRADGAAPPYKDPAGTSHPPAMQYPFPPGPLQRSGESVDRPTSLKSVLSVTERQQIRSVSSSSSLSTSIKASEQPPIETVQNKRLSRLEAVDKMSSSLSARSSSRASSVETSLLHRRKASTDRHRSEAGLPSSTVAFSSSFSEPYFPLNAMEPDETDVPGFEGSHDGAACETSSIFDEIIDDPDAAGDDAAKVTVLIQLVPGLRAYVEPHVGFTAAKMFSNILPQGPEEVLDVFMSDVLGSVASQQQGMHAKNSTLELRIGLPTANMRVLNRNPEDRVADQVQLRLHEVQTGIRISNRPEQGKSDDRLAVHARVGSVDTSVGTYMTGQPTAPAARINVDDTLAYVAVSAAQSISASIRDTLVAVSGDHAEYLTDMVLRVMPTVLDISSKFGKTLSKDQRKLKQLIYTLIQNPGDLGDPTFLSRITYILRAFPDHFRNQESWRALARFRNILDNLPPKIVCDVAKQFGEAEGEGSVSPEVFSRALHEWAQERTWDEPNMSQTLMFRMLSDDNRQESTVPEERKPTAIRVRSEYLRLAIESGQNANELIVEDTSFDMEGVPPTAPTGLMLMEENTRSRTTIQAHTASIGLSLNWSAFDIVEKILPLAGKIQSIVPPSKGASRSTGEVMEDALSRQTLQVVVSTDSGSLSLCSVNLRHVSRLEGMRMSLLGTTQAGGSYGPCASLIFNSDAAITELHGPTRRVWKTVLTSPSVYVDYVTPAAGADIPPSLVIAVAYRNLRLKVEEQAPGLMHLVDSVILDEVAKGVALAENIKSIAAQAPTSGQAEAQKVHSKQAKSSASNTSAVKVHFALLAGKLHFEIALLQELNYQLDGTAASVRVAPSLFTQDAWAIDFDVGQNRHCFVNSSASKRLEQTILEVPPLNGHIGLELAREVISLSVVSTMQRVEIDATAIQSMLGVLNRPEVQHVIEEIKEETDVIKGHIEDTVPMDGTATKPESQADARSIAFNVRFAFLGVRVATTTPMLKGTSTASIEFGIGPVHVVASNRENLTSSKTLIPEVRAQIRDIGAKLEVHEKGKVCSCGNATVGLELHFKSQLDNSGKLARQLSVESQGLEVNAYPETAATAVDVVNHLQDRIKNLDVSKEVEYLRRLRERRKTSVIQRVSGKQIEEGEQAMAFSAIDLRTVTTTVQFRNIQLAWIVNQSYAVNGSQRVADLVFSLDCIELITRGGREARLTFEDLQIQLADKDAPLTKRALNSAILPEVIFSVAYFKEDKKRSFAFRATGSPLEVRLQSKFMYPVNAAQRSIESAIEKCKAGTAAWENTPTASGAPRQNIVDFNHLASVLVEADFAGTEIYMQGSGPRDPRLSVVTAASQQHGSHHGRYGQFATEGARTEAILRAPGFGTKVEYNSAREGKQSSLNGEVRIDASSNSILPSIVPLLLEVSDSVKEVMQSEEDTSKPPTPPAPAGEKTGPQRFFEDESIVKADPTAFFGKMKVDLGLRICRQEFALTCQPIAKVDAQANLEDLYITMNTVESHEHGHFFALSAAITKLDAQVKHLYSREPTFTFDMDSIVLSVLNSKHLSGASGISTILKIHPTRTFINGKQLQDLLLFREIWMPPEIRNAQPASPTPASSKDQPEEFFAQRYQSVAAAAAFPWNATVQIAELAVDLDLGQSIGKSSFTMHNLWASQAKSSNWEQNLCVGIDEMAMNSTGRMSGFIRLNRLGVRTTIKWPEQTSKEKKTPLIQASVGFSRLLAKAAFDYQAFAFGDIEGFDFLMYNVREGHGSRDRLVAVLDCEKAYVFCTSTSPAQAVGLFQAFERLIQEKQTAFTQSLRDIEKHLRRDSTVVPTRFGPKISTAPTLPVAQNKTSISLHTDVVVTMGAISFGVFPSTFFDSQILKLEANNIQARFAVGLEQGKIRSGLGMTLGQLQVALASARRITAVPKALDVSVDDVISSAVNSKGGTILRVPKVVASMETWQAPESNNVDFIFKSLFSGKIDVGWNLSRINFIKGMYMTHDRALAARLGKALPESAVKITAGPADEGKASNSSASTAEGGQEKITAEVNLPQSKYEYNALETPIIETPQLRDMGEATPPLEWIGLNRERLPNVTHQIIIVSLLEVAKEVEDAYERILGSS